MGKHIIYNKHKVYNDKCNGKCFTIEFRKDITMKAIALWYKFQSKVEQSYQHNCSSPIILTSIVIDSNSICKDIFKRNTGISSVYMVYANCNPEGYFIIAGKRLFIKLEITQIELVEIAVYNKQIIESMLFKCIGKRAGRSKTIKHQTQPIILLDKIIDHRHLINKLSKIDHDLISGVLSDFNINRCIMFPVYSGIISFTFVFDSLVIIESITFVAGDSFENNKLFMIKELSATPDEKYRVVLDNINECKQKSLKDIVVFYNGYIIHILFMKLVIFLYIFNIYLYTYIYIYIYIYLLCIKCLYYSNMIIIKYTYNSII